MTRRVRLAISGWLHPNGRRGRGSALVAAAVLLCMVVAASLALGLGGASADEPSSEVLAPTAAQTRAFLESEKATDFGEAETDRHAAETMPHRDLGGEEALELAEAVFEPEIEDVGGLIAELEPERFLSDNAAVVPASSLPEEAGPGEEGLPAEHPHMPVLIESTLPLRTENEEGEKEAVDLGLERPEGAEGDLQPANPLAELEIPAELGQGIALPGPEVQINVAGAPAESPPTDVEGHYAFYPNIAEDTDLIVTPTPTGVETMTDIRSAQARLATTFELSLPEGAALKPGPRRSVAVFEEGKPAVLIPPPSAIDAAGEPVPVTQTIEGDELTVEASPDPSAQYPILVDPQFIVESWNWTFGHHTMAAWSPNSNDPGLATFPYAYWETTTSPPNPSPAPGLDLTSAGWGNGIVGGQAQWVYTVPRYSQDMSKFGKAPTTWIANFVSENDWFLTHGHPEEYPALLIGLAAPGSANWWTVDGVHYGSQGDFSGISADYANTSPEPLKAETKAADFDLFTFEIETPSKYRDTYLGGATVAVVDEDAPVIKSLSGPTGWLTGSSPQAIAYSFEDDGLGVQAASARLAGERDFKWLTLFGCSGAVTSPCPRAAASSESGRSALQFVPAELPTGEDKLEVDVSDPLGGAEHLASEYLSVKIDNAAPDINLWGALTEQERLGTHLAEYPLSISVSDGSSLTPQSGVASVELKVDGKKITMPNETPWHPACKTENCAFSGSWTLKSSEYAAGSHEVEVLATDALGNVSTSTLEFEVGQGAPQTSFTTPHPTYENHEIEAVGFKATREGAPVEGASFKCSFDGAAATSCASPYKLPGHLDPEKWHLLTVTAVDKSGIADPTPARWRFKTGDYSPAPKSEKLVYPEVGKKTASYYTLEAEWGGNPEGNPSEGVTGVSFQMKLPAWKEFRPVPVGCTIDGQGRVVSWPLPVHIHPGHSAPVYLKVRGCPAFEAESYPEKEVQFRAVFDGGEKVAGASEPAATEFVYRNSANRVLTDATQSVGPATLDLLTGAFTISRTDVSIPVPGYEANLEFTRVYSSTVDKTLPGFSNVLGGGWQPSSPLEAEFEGEAWSRIVEQVIPERPAQFERECWNEEEETIDCPYPEPECPQASCERWEVEQRQPKEEWIELLDNEGAGIPFEISGESLISPEYARELKLKREEGNITLSYPNGTHTTFVPGAQHEWVPKFISYQSSPSSMRMVYEPIGSGQRLVKEIAPAAVECPDSTSKKTLGCRTLELEYSRIAVGNEFTEVLAGIRYYGPSGEGGTRVAEYGYGAYAVPGGKLEARLIWERDPRLPEMAEWCNYYESPSYSNLIAGLVPSGQEPWSFNYEFGTSGNPSRLKSVSRAGATSTIAYGVPLTGSAAPYDMGAASIAGWGQSDLPVDATAIFPPNHVPAEYPPHAYTGATVHYMDPEGHEVNTASPSPPGVTGQSITTSETDVHGDVVRELGARDRLIALESSNSAALSHELDSHSVYNAAGTEMLESWGPLHRVRLESGETVEARLHTVTHYDEGEPAPKPGTLPAFLPTKETVSAVTAGGGAELEPRTTETHYNWGLRKPTETIVDPGGLNLRTVTEYNAAGQVIETRQPSNPSGGGAGTTKMVYFSAIASPEHPGECENNRFANLPCKIMPAAQASGTGRPKLIVKTFSGYDELDEPTLLRESAGGEGEERTTTTTYDAAGRPVSVKVKGGGSELPAVKIEYSPTMGMPTRRSFVCEQKECAGFDSQATTVEYNKLGQAVAYEDADGAVTKSTYDAFGRPATVTDPKGTQTFHYDEASGALTSMEVSGIGTFTASYDADGDLIHRGLPNGLTANTTFNQADEPTKLTYTKTSSCGESCTWYEETLERSAGGRILADSSSLVRNSYFYDHAGRLTEAQETPTGGECTSRLYTFDADSNRLTKATRSSGIGGLCPTSGGTVQKYEYDAADRLMGTGLVYDPWGRIMNLPAELAGGKALTTTYFGNNMVASQSQGGVTNTYQLDAAGRQRQREQTGGVEGVQIFHYDGSSDSPSWTSLGSTWSRSVAGLGGELAAVQESTGTVTFKLTDLHGNVVASANSSPTELKLLATYRFDEFGEPESGNAGRFGWLGGKSRRTELSAGIVQMGRRSYVPAIGRFISPDPVPGGSASSYDYANADPLNQLDLSGEKAGASDCLVSVSCECKLWSHLKKGKRGTMVLTVVRKCSRTGGITKTGYAAQWSQRASRREDFHNIPSVARATPALEPLCRGDTNPCQNYQKSEYSILCKPGHEYQLSISWGFTFNIWGEGPEHQLHVEIQQECPK